MTSQNLQVHTLDSFCQNSSSLRAKIALSTFYKVKFPPWIEKFILVFEYLQLMSQALLSASFISENTEHDRLLIEIVVYILKLVNPCYLFTYKSSSKSTISPILVILFAYTWMKFVLFAHIAYASARNKKIRKWLLSTWRWIYRFQPRVLYFLFSSFWVRAIIEAKENGFGLFGMSEAPMIFISCMMIVADFTFSLTLETQLCYFLPTNNFLSAKNNHLDLTTFLQKFIIQITLLIFKSNSEALAWIIPIVGVTMDIVRLWILFSTLPLYRMKALSLQGGLLSTVMSINLASFVNIILQSSDYKGASINFLIITWILLALLINKVVYEVLKIQTLALLVRNNSKRQRPELLLHKVALTKELYRNEKIPTGDTLNFNFDYLVSMQQNLNIQEIFGLDNVPDDLSSDPKIMKNIYLYYYQELSKKYPKNSLIKLHTAYRSFKNSEPYTKVIKLANEVQKHRWSENYLGSCLLLYEIEKSIFSAHKKKDQNLDLYTYMKSRMQIDKLRNDILEQTNLHIKICSNMLSDICDIEEIHHSAQKISHLKINIHKKIDRLSRNLSEYYISPLLVYAEYNLVANYSKENFEKYYEMYSQKYHKAQRFFQEPKLQEENLYQGSNALILISTQKSEYGKILYCSQSLVDLCGGQTIKLYEGSNISILFPRCLKEYYENFFQQNIETSMNTIHRAYLYHKDKHLVEVDFCFKYHPYLTQGLCLTMIIRPVPTGQDADFLLLSEDGNIEGASKKISTLLGLKRRTSSSAVSIKDLSEELYLINNAFNIALRKENKITNVGDAKSNLSDWMSKFLISRNILESSSVVKSPKIPREKAEEIYSVFTSEGQEVTLRPYDEKFSEEKSFTFHSQIQVLEYKSVTMKLVALIKKSKGYDHESKKAKIAMPESPFLPSPRILTGEERSVISENFEFEDYAGQTMVTDFRQQQSLRSPNTIMTDRRPLMGETLATDFSLVQSPQQRKVINLKNATSVHKTGTLLSVFESSLGNHEDDDSKLGKLESVYRQRKIHKYVSTQSSMTGRSGERVENKLFKAAIVSKTYPKSFTSLCFIFFLVILMTFASQIIMKVVSDTTMDDLQIKKTMLRDSEEMTYKGSWIQLNGVGIMLVIVQLLAAGGNYVSMNETVTNLQVRISDMKTANDGLLELVNSLDKDTQNYMFKSDVQINGTYLDGQEVTSKNVNIFEVTSEMGNAIRAFSNLYNPSSMAGYRIATYFKYNLVNDFQYKGAKITEMLTESVSDQKESFQYVTNLFLILNPFLLTGIGILLCCIIWNQYRIEKENLRAFVKLPPEGVKMMANRLYQFQKSLSSEEVFAKKWVNLTNTGVYDSRRLDRQSAYSRKFETQKIKYEALRKRYSKYIARVIISISVLVAINIWDLVTTRQAIKVIYNRQSQLQYANYISNRVVLTHITVNELFLTNNTLRVAHKIPYEGILELIQTVKDIQSDIPSKFLEVDGTYNPEVKKIIFNDNPTCEGFADTFIHYCYVQVAAGRSTDMMVTLSYYQTLMNQKVNDYVNVDKSSMNKIIAVALASDASLTPAVVLAEEAHRIAGIMDASMTQRINEMQDLKIVIIIIFVISLAIVSVLIWVYILQVIRDVHNDLKRVLQIFPPNLVLSSYLLKRFLQRTSNGMIFREL